MHTDCTSTQLAFEGLGRRSVVGRFDGGRLTTDGGVLLLREVDRRFQVTSRAGGVLPATTATRGGSSIAWRRWWRSGCWPWRRATRTSTTMTGCAPTVPSRWRAGAHDVTGERRAGPGACGDRRGMALAGSSTLNRLELGVPEAAAGDRYQRIVADPDAMDRLLVDLFLEAHATPPAEIVLDLDATDDPLHGRQEGRVLPRPITGTTAISRCT